VREFGHAICVTPFGTTQKEQTMNAIHLLAQNDATGGTILGGALAVMIIFWILALAATVFWLWMLIDALTNEPTTNDKILWLLVIFFLHFIGALIYFFVRRSARSGTVAR
jgi:hypothetical protein